MSGFDDFELHTVEIELLPDLGDAVELGDDEPAEGVDVFRSQFNPQGLVRLLQLDLRVEEHGSVLLRLCEDLLLVELVPYLAHEFLLVCTRRGGQVDGLRVPVEIQAAVAVQRNAAHRFTFLAAEIRAVLDHAAVGRQTCREGVLPATARGLYWRHRGEVVALGLAHDVNATARIQRNPLSPVVDISAPPH